MRPAAVPEAERYLAARREKFIDAICANIRYNKMRAEQAFFVAEPENFLLAHTARDIAGLLVLCFTPAGAARFLRLASERGLYGGQLRQKCG